MIEHDNQSPAGHEPSTTPEAAAPADLAAAALAHTPHSSELHTVSLDDEPQPSAPEHAEANVSVIREGNRRYGQSFLAYLILDGVEQRSPDLIEQYEARTLGAFADRRSFTRWAIADLGWEAELTELRHLQGMWPDDVAWNLDALWPELIERYAVTERLGGVHAFRR